MWELLFPKPTVAPNARHPFGTILNHGLKTDEDEVKRFVVEGAHAIPDERLRTIVEFALKVNADAAAIKDDDIARLRKVDISDRALCNCVIWSAISLPTIA